jgi:hypothetical protein
MRVDGALVAKLKEDPALLVHEDEADRLVVHFAHHRNACAAPWASRNTEARP